MNTVNEHFIDIICEKILDEQNKVLRSTLPSFIKLTLYVSSYNSKDLLLIPHGDRYDMVKNYTTDMVALTVEQSAKITKAINARDSAFNIKPINKDLYEGFEKEMLDREMEDQLTTTTEEAV